MEQEYPIQDLFDDSSFDFGMLMDQPGDFAVDVVAEEDPKSVKRDSSNFLVTGILSMLAGAGIIVAANMDMGFKQLLPYLIGAGIGALGFGLIRAFRRVFSKRKLNLPSLKLQRKVLRSESNQSRGFQSAAQTPNSAPNFQSQFQRAKAAANAAAAAASQSFKDYPQASKGKKLGKSYQNKVFMGVASGLAEYAGVNSALIRMIFVMGFFFSAGLITLLYIFLGIVLPQKSPTYGR